MYLTSLNSTVSRRKKCLSNGIISIGSNKNWVNLISSIELLCTSSQEFCKFHAITHDEILFQDHLVFGIKDNKV